MVDDRRLLCDRVRDSFLCIDSFRLVLLVGNFSSSVESDSEELWSKVMVVCLCTGVGLCFRGAGTFLSSECFVEGFGRSDADLSCRRRGVEVTCFSFFKDCSVV